MSHKPGCELCYQRNKYSAALDNDVYCADCKLEIDTILDDVKRDLAIDDFDSHVHSDEMGEDKV